MRDLLHNYFLTDYQMHPLFHKDYFLRDLLTGNTCFCSSVLVNAILAYVCVSDKLPSHYVLEVYDLTESEFSERLPRNPKPCRALEPENPPL